ncbi:hypothetical protein SpCBS45565_g03593 [Spizellomyces sp. 'palustris']|nr:hypothetical protein SpCBS45565_g03593 [Spizellomyces sp. 'palustris']
MCSIEEEIQTGDAETPIIRNRRRLVVDGLCHKCKQSPPVVDMKRVMYCKLLLHLLSEFHEPDPSNLRKKRKFSDVVICHVDQSAVLGGEDKEAEVRRIGEESGFPYLHMPLESIFNNDDGSDGGALVLVGFDLADTITLKMVHQVTSKLSPVARLRRSIHGLGKMTAKEDLLQHFTMRALLNTARKEGCNVLILGDNATRMAIRILALTSKGGGFGLPIEVAGDTDWFEGLVVARPLRDVLSKEVAVYNQYTDLDAVVMPALTTAMPAKSSIDRLTEEFVVGLQRDFPMTVNTVVRTAAKVKSEHRAKTVMKCPMCGGPIQDGTNDWRSGHTVSQVLSDAPSSDPTSGTLSSASNTLPCSASCACASTVNPESTSTSCCTPADQPINIIAYLCYPCQNICRDAQEFGATAAKKGIDDVTVILPSYVGEEITMRKGREWMKKEIEEFLIDEEE